MRPYLFLHTVAIVVFSSFVFGSYIPRWKVTEVFEDISDYDTHIGQDLQPKYTVFLDEDELGRPKPHHDTEKRGYYTCFNRQTNSINVADCQAVIDRIKATNQVFSVPSGLCLNWWQDTCMSRLCAKVGAARGLNMTSDAVVNELQDVILNDCVKVGLDGMAGDCLNMVNNCGTYRVTLEHHGSGVLGGPPPT